MQTFVTRRLKTPKYVWPIVLSPLILFGLSIWNYGKLYAIMEDNGFYVCVFFLLLPALLAFLWSKKYNLFSFNDLTITISDEGISTKHGELENNYQWKEIHDLKIVEQMTPAGYFNYLRLWTIKQMYYKRTNTYHKYYPAVDFFFYGFDKTATEIKDAFAEGIRIKKAL